MKSTYKTHRMSKYKYKTDKTLVGHKLARTELERRLGRRLRDGTKVVSRAGNWVFQEPKGPAFPSPKSSS